MSAMQIEQVQEQLDAAPPVQRIPCDCHGCTAAATTAIRFHNQAGHVHDCSYHTAGLREWSDVAESAPLPCPWPHDGTDWVDKPRDLA